MKRIVKSKIIEPTIIIAIGIAIWGERQFFFFIKRSEGPLVFFFKSAGPLVFFKFVFFQE